MPVASHSEKLVSVQQCLVAVLCLAAVSEQLSHQQKQHWTVCLTAAAAAQRRLQVVLEAHPAVAGQQSSLSWDAQQVRTPHQMLCLSCHLLETSMAPAAACSVHQAVVLAEASAQQQVAVQAGGVLLLETGAQQAQHDHWWEGS